MPLFPFTPKGVEDKLTALYALPDTLLLLEASAIRTAFRSWVTSNFILSAPQTIYLDNMDDRAVNYFGHQCSICFEHRLPIILIYPEPPQTPGYTKWTVTKDDISVEADGTGQRIVSGSFTFTISYRYS